MNINKAIGFYYKCQANGKLRHDYLISVKITEVIVIRKSYTEWIVKLKLTKKEAILNTKEVILYTKRDSIRTFRMLESAANFIKSLEVDIFTVEQYDQLKDSPSSSIELIN